MWAWAIALACVTLAQALNMLIPGRSWRGELPPLTAEEVVLRDRLARHVDMLAGVIGQRNVWTPGTLDASARYISDTLRQLGYAVDEQPYDVQNMTVKNLTAELRGAGKADEILIVGAHYDTVPDCPGANDNASGVAAMLEIARLLRDSRPQRTIRFVAFVNEEPPFFQTDEMGSMVYAKRCRQQREKIVGMIALETIGCYSDRPGSQHYPAPFGLARPATGNFIGFVSDLGSLRWLRRCVGSFRGHTKFPSEAAALPGWIEGVGWSDHWSFWQCGYRALMVTDTAPFRYRHYHQPSDTPDKLDYDRTARVVAGIARVVQDQAR